MEGYLALTQETGVQPSHPQPTDMVRAAVAIMEQLRKRQHELVRDTLKGMAEAYELLREVEKALCNGTEAGSMLDGLAGTKEPIEIK